MVMLVLLLTGIAVLSHALAVLSERNIAAHLGAAILLLAVTGLACLSGRAVPVRPDVDQLLREKQAAEAASAAKSRYLASVSHEIRSPLNAIYGYAQLMERGTGADPAEAARIIRRSAEHLTTLVDGLLDMSLIENGMLRISSDVVRLAPFLDQIADMMRPEATAKGLAFRHDRPARLPEFVRMDEKRLRQVLINLLSNAIKFTDAGAVNFRMGWSGPLATFEVTDTGPGIAAADRERIFLPFERGTQTRPGIGLGLAITRTLVHIQGGALDLESVPGAGSTFRVRLMMGQVTSGGVDDRDRGTPIAGYEGPRRSVLIVDDDPQQREMTRRLLEPFGFMVETAADGAAALAMCEAGRFDLVMLDVSMPGLSGWEVAGRLRARHGAMPRILMLSAHVGDRPAREGEPVHDLFLTKPVPLGPLLDGVGTLLSLRWVHEEAEAPPDPIPTDSALPEAALPHADKLRDLLRIGHVRGIEGEIRLLAEAAPASGEMIARLYACLDRFDLPALRATLDEYA